MKISKEVYRAIRMYPEAYDEGIKAGAAVRVVNQETGEVTIEWRVCD